MASKWTTEVEVTALLSLIYHTHKGCPKLDRMTCVQLEADLAKHHITADGARQHVQKLLRNFSPNTSDNTGANMAKEMKPATSKRKAPGSSVPKSPKKRAKKTAVNVHVGYSSNELAEAAYIKQEGGPFVKAEDVKESEPVIPGA
ncbi:MAG: hypothetical protein LQ343_004418 [Gyalolechia ehrenbergii]|nr:MAG: hypothetical protein LQ343_004418 [Gyalolechia ehrenbergii]